MTNPTPDEEWQPPADVKPWMVCAACRSPSGYIVTGPRHWDVFMRKAVVPYMSRSRSPDETHDWDQGFIDQWGRFYQRDEAMEAVRASGQPFNIERNGGSDDELYSEGLY